MLHMASIYQDPKASNRLLGTTGEGDTFVYDWPKRQFTWTCTPSDPCGFDLQPLKSSLQHLAKDLVSGNAVLSTEDPYLITYAVHPAPPPQYR